MQWYEEEVKGVEERAVKHLPKEDLVVFYGSSSFRLWDGLKEEFSGVNIINTAFGGSTLEACGYFFERVFKGLNPKAIFFYAGDNDIGDGKNPLQIIEYFRVLARKLRDAYPTTPFVFVSIKPSPSRWGLKDKILQTNALIKEEIEGDENSFYLDIYDKMLTDGAPDTSYFEPDMLHMSKKGYALWAKELKQNFPQFLSV